MNSNLRSMLPVYMIMLLSSTLQSVSISGPVMPLYIHSLGIGIIDWSLLVTSSALGMFLFEWIWGTLSDRVNGKHLMLFSTIAMSIILPLYAIPFPVTYFFVLQFIWGAICVVLSPITRSYVSGEAPPESVGLMVSLLWAFGALGRIIGPLVGSYLAEYCSFGCSFYASSAMALVLACVVVLTFPKTGRRTTQRATPSHRAILKERSVWLLFLSTVFTLMTFPLMRSFLPLYASQQIGMSAFEVGTLLSATAAAQLVAIPLFGWLSDRFGRKLVVVVGFGSSSVMFLFFLVAGTQSWLFLVSMAVSVGLSATSLLLAMIPEIAPNSRYGTHVGLYGSSEDLGTIIGPIIFGFVWSAFSPVLIFIVGSIVQLVSALLILGIRPKRVPRPTMD